MTEKLESAIKFAKKLIEKDADIISILVFGSVARGDFSEDSDVDLLIRTAAQKGKNCRDIFLNRKGLKADIIVRSDLLFGEKQEERLLKDKQFTGMFSECKIILDKDGYFNKVNKKVIEMTEKQGRRHFAGFEKKLYLAKFSKAIDKIDKLYNNNELIHLRFSMNNLLSELLNFKLSCEGIMKDLTEIQKLTFSRGKFPGFYKSIEEFYSDSNDGKKIEALKKALYEVTQPLGQLCQEYDTGWY